MIPINLAPGYRRFIDEELLRLPLLADQLIDAALVAMRQAMPSFSPQERSLNADLLKKTEQLRDRLGKAFADSVREQVAAEVSAEMPTADGPKSKLPVTLELLGDEDVAADVETSQAIKAIKDIAEHELRELATYISALAGDMDVARDHNPFRAEAFARALWDMAHALPMARGHQVRLMQHASAPLAELLRRAYAASTARLEAEGVEPAVYRTVVLSTRGRPSRLHESWSGIDPDLRSMRAEMPTHGDDDPRTSQMPLERVIEDADRALRSLPPDASLTVHAELAAAQRARITRYAEQSADQQLIELLSRLFDAILLDPLVGRDIQITLSRLQASLLRLALRDPAMLDDYAHPAWRFMDHIAHQASLQPAGSTTRAEILRFAESLIDGLSQEMAPDAARYEWTIERLVANDNFRIEKCLQRRTAEIRMLQEMEDQLADRGESFPTGAGPLDEEQIETIPADLLNDLPQAKSEPDDRATWLDARLPGDWFRLFLKGRWTRTQLLWQGRHGDVWMLADEDGEEIYALRRRALDRLYSERLASTLHPRSLVRAAALQVMHTVSDGSSRAPLA